MPQLIARTQLQAGEIRQSPDLSVSHPGTGTIKIQFTSFNQDWDDPSLILTGALYFSRDSGQTFQLASSITINGGTRNKLGEIPAFTWIGDLTNVTHLRGTIVANVSMRLGIDGEII
jgi:hypothetical protein